MSSNWADIFRKKKPVEQPVNKTQVNLNRSLWTGKTNAPVSENFIYDVKPANVWRQRLIKRALNGERIKYKEPWKTRRNLRRMSPLNPNFKRATMNKKRKAPNSNSNNNNPDR